MNSLVILIAGLAVAWNYSKMSYGASEARAEAGEKNP